jgi:hypothetical protein
LAVIESATRLLEGNNGLLLFVVVSAVVTIVGFDIHALTLDVVTRFDRLKEL